MKVTTEIIPSNQCGKHWPPRSLRPGNIHSAAGWEELLLPEIERQQQQGKEVVFRADAAFAKPEIFHLTLG